MKTEIKKTKGFTLVELMITLIVLGILLGLAIPSFINLYNRNKLTTSANKIVAMVNAARISAIKQNSTVSLCQDVSVATNCSSAATILAASALEGISSSILVQNSTQIDFGADGIGEASGSSGIPYSGLVADVYTNSLTTDNHRCIEMVGGSSVRSCTLTGNCPTTGTICP